MASPSTSAMSWVFCPPGTESSRSGSVRKRSKTRPLTESRSSSLFTVRLAEEDLGDQLMLLLALSDTKLSSGRPKPLELSIEATSTPAFTLRLLWIVRASCVVKSCLLLSPPDTELSSGAPKTLRLSIKATSCPAFALRSPWTVRASCVVKSCLFMGFPRTTLSGGGPKMPKLDQTLSIEAASCPACTLEPPWSSGDSRTNKSCWPPCPPETWLPVPGPDLQASLCKRGPPLTLTRGPGSLQANRSVAGCGRLPSTAPASGG
mmetsp:Transcript_46356/g.140646  ORF Transcript_46356/g.140646 Transcript_46356/m.140646 type:complete len:262 (+) Transcript_46356:1022-1807(+)